MAAANIDQTLDVTGLKCPLPILKAKKALAQMNAGQVLQVLATDLDAYSRWAHDTLFKLPNVKDIHTSFSLGEVKAGAALPLGHLPGYLAGHARANQRDSAA